VNVSDAMLSNYDPTTHGLTSNGWVKLLYFLCDT
jgi:hypothetical protein